MARPSYDPYYLHHHHNHRQQPPELYYHPTNLHETTSQSCLYNEPPPTSISASKVPTILIPKEQRHINTLFVSGLPDDILPREIHNLFRRRPGFDSCQLKFTGRGNQVVAFVTFFNHQSAVLALQSLHGIKYDPQGGSVLHVELARSNSRRKVKPGSGAYVVIDERKKAADGSVETSTEDAGDNESDNSSQNGDLSNDDVHSSEKSDVNKADLNDPEAAENKPKEKTSESDLQPCSTLFIANLGSKCSEEELKQALSQFPGFNGLKLRGRGGIPVAFADYEEVEQAAEAMKALQDSMLPSSDRGGMNIEYARSKMRKL